MTSMLVKTFFADCEVSAAMQYFNLSNISDSPTHPLLKDDLWLDSEENRSDILLRVTTELITSYVDLGVHSTTSECSDKVQCYASELSMGLLYMEFSDSIREGDGLCILRCCVTSCLF